MAAKYKLVNGVLFKDDLPAQCPEKGVIPISRIDDKKENNLAIHGRQAPQVVTTIQYFFCMESCAKFVKRDPFGSELKSTGRLACCGVEFKIESEEKKVAPPAKKDLNIN